MIPLPTFKGCWVIPVPLFMGGWGGGCGQIKWTGVVGIDTTGSLFEVEKDFWPMFSRVEKFQSLYLGEKFGWRDLSMSICLLGCWGRPQDPYLGRGEEITVTLCMWGGYS